MPWAFPGVPAFRRAVGRPASMSTKAKHPGHPEDDAQTRAHEAHLHEDDAIVVPKGTSKLRFIFLLGLTIIILIVFTVGDQLTSSVGRNPGNSEHVTWDGPLVGKRAYTKIEFLDLKRREDDFRRPLGQRRSDLDDESLAAELLVDELAQQSGIAVSDAELGTAIRDGHPSVCPPFQSFDIYKQLLKSYGITPSVFEGVLRRKLRVQRYLELLRGATLVADSSLIDAEWKKLNPQHAYDVVEVEHAAFDAEAKAAQPDAAGLQAWYEAIPDKRSLFFLDYLPATIAAEVIAYRFNSADNAAGLLAKYPLPADKDLQQLARDYYNQYSSVRFVRETPLPAGSPEAEGKDRLINSFEEVEPTAKTEAPILEAFRAWVADVKARKLAGESIDLAAEATALGLFHRPSDGARAEADWSTLEEIGGPFLSRSIAGSPAGDFGADVSVDRRGIAFPRVLEKNESAPPPFEKIAEKAATEWLKQKTQELAVAKLNAVRDAFPKPEEGAENPNPKADEAAFLAAAQAQGLQVIRRDWMTPSQQNNDPQASTPAHEFVRFSGFLRGMGADEVSAVQQDRMRLRSYLVRALGQREPPEIKLTPREVETIQGTLASKSFEDFVEANFTPKALAERYKLRVSGSKDLPEPGA